MYTLRKVIEGQEECNFNLGNYYSLIEESKFPKHFEQTFEMVFNNCPPYTDDKCYAFVTSEKGKVEPLWLSQKNYIMTENGKTFSNLSIK